MTVLIYHDLAFFQVKNSNEAPRSGDSRAIIRLRWKRRCPFPGRLAEKETSTKGRLWSVGLERYAVVTAAIRKVISLRNAEKGFPRLSRVCRGLQDCLAVSSRWRDTSCYS